MDKKSARVIIISIIALAIVVITITYAYFSARITGIESASTLSLTAGTMGITYTEGNEEVTFENIYPKSDPWVTKTFTLTANNTTALTMYYDLGLNVITNTFPNNYLTYDLTLVSSTNGTAIATKTNQPINGTGKIKFGKGLFSDATNDTHNYELKIYFKDSGEDQNEGQGKVFNAKIYVEEAFNEPKGWASAQNGTLLYALKNDSKNTIQTPLTTPGQEKTKVVYDKIFSISETVQTLTDTQLSQTFTYGMYGQYTGYVYSIMYYSSYDDLNTNNNGSDLSGEDYQSGYSNLNDKYIKICQSKVEGPNDTYISCSGTPYYVRSATPDALTYSEVLTEVLNEEDSEILLASTEDDYGTSYYYRGAVENNYVVFANMCWRIVRVDGAGNTKLVLYNYNPNNVQNPCASTEDGETNAFARYNNTYQSAFNTNYNKNTYVGYMYSNNPDSSDFDIAHANDNDSTILTFLKSWYDEKLRTYNDMLADVIWCNDKSIVTDTTYDPWTLGNIQATGLGTDKTYYNATYRLNPVNTAAPSLVCPTAGSDGKLSKFTARDTVNGNAKLYSNNKEYKIGLLTADEIAFAGNKMSEGRGDGNTSYYLYNNTSGGWYWSMSPLDFNGRSASVWSVREGGELDGDVVNDVSGVRPAVSLKSTVSMVSGGDGTKTNPFVVSA